MKIKDARAFAMSLPEVTEEPHFEMSSFRVRKKIFATVPDDAHLHVFVDEDGVREAVAEDARAFEELWWGRRLSGVRVNLSEAKKGHVTELLTDAWRRKAPKRLAAELDAKS